MMTEMRSVLASGHEEYWKEHEGIFCGDGNALYLDRNMPW